jgi:hypothetical protein
MFFGHRQSSSFFTYRNRLAVLIIFNHYKKPFRG